MPTGREDHPLSREHQRGICPFIISGRQYPNRGYRLTTPPRSATQAARELAARRDRFISGAFYAMFRQCRTT
jgi:hypothetical protein